MTAAQSRLLADGRIDYDHYHRRLRRLRRVAKRRAGHTCAQALRPLIGAALIAAAFVLIPAGAADCIVCSKPVIAVIASHH